jgi:hypothetical protein
MLKINDENKPYIYYEIIDNYKLKIHKSKRKIYKVGYYRVCWSIDNLKTDVKNWKLKLYMILCMLTNIAPFILSMTLLALIFIFTIKAATSINIFIFFTALLIFKMLYVFNIMPILFLSEGDINNLKNNLKIYKEIPWT